MNPSDRVPVQFKLPDGQSRFVLTQHPRLSAALKGNLIGGVRSRSRAGRAFEEAVYHFVNAAFDGNAKVSFDHRVPDRDTGFNRQVDVWVETLLANHFPFRLLISCKDYGRKLDVGHIGQFCDEIRSTGANAGVIYSRNGFTKAGLLKAQANQISCCRLVDGKPWPMPRLGMKFFASHPRISLELVMPEPISSSRKLSDFLGLASIDPKFETFDEELKAKLKTLIEESLSACDERATFPRDSFVEIRAPHLRPNHMFKINLGVLWAKYRAKREVTADTGSFNLTAKSFIGNLRGPSVNVTDGNISLGADWEEITDNEIVEYAGQSVLITYGQINDEFFNEIFNMIQIA